NGQCYASGVTLGNPASSDNCGGAVAVTNNAPAAFPNGTNAVIWTATDSCGNSSTSTQQVIVVDNQPPLISCPAHILTNAPDASDGTITFALSATDNCDGNVE